MAKHDLTFDGLEALIDAAPENDRFGGIDAAVMKRMSDLDLRRITLALRLNPAPASARISALAEQELADRATRSNKWTMGYAAAGLFVSLASLIVALF